MSNYSRMTFAITITFFLMVAVVFGIGAANRHEIPSLFQNVVSIENHCTGFIMPNNLVFTAKHCVVENEAVNGPVSVYFFDGLMGSFRIVATGAEMDSRDWAILAGDTRGIEPFQFKRTPLKDGTACGHVGHGGGSPRQLGILCNVIKAKDQDGYIYLSDSSIGGDSGSPVFDLDTFEVFGIIVRSAYPMPKGYAVDINLPIAVARKLENGAYKR